MDGGIYKRIDLYLINFIALVFVCAFNLLKAIQQNREVFIYFTYIAPFLILIGLNYLCKKRNWYKWNALLYAALGMGTIFGNDPGNYSGVVFIVFSLYIFNTTRTNIILLLVTGISIVAKNVFFVLSITDTVNTFIVYGYSILIYYILIHPKKPNIYTGLDEITREIIEYKMAGWSTKAVADKVCLSTDAVQKRISRACDKYDAGNLAQLVYKLMKKGYIST